MKVIKKHPIALTLFMGYELFAVAVLLSVVPNMGENWMFVIGLMAGISWLIFLGGLIAWLISAIRRKKNGKAEDSGKKQIDILARTYMTSTPHDAFIFIMIAVMSPIIPVLLVWVLNYYMVGVLLINFGIMVWVIRFAGEYLTNAFYNVPNAKEYFSIESGESDELADSFYGDIVHGYTEHSFTGTTPKFIATLLKREKALKTDIKAYRISSEFLSQKYGYDYSEHFNSIVFVPFSQFDINERSLKTLITYFNRISVTDYTNLVNMKYQPKESLEPADYAYTDENIMLDTFGSEIVIASTKNNALYIALNCAHDAANRNNTYYNCLMVVNGAKSVVDDSAEKHCTMGFIGSLKFTDDNVLEITICSGGSDDDEYYDYEDDYEEIVVRYKYDKVQWYWDGFCNSEKSRSIFNQIK